jgi:hypothetical protein
MDTPLASRFVNLSKFDVSIRDNKPIFILVEGNGLIFISDEYTISLVYESIDIISSVGIAVSQTSYQHEYIGLAWYTYNDSVSVWVSSNMSTSLTDLLWNQTILSKHDISLYTEEMIQCMSLISVQSNFDLWLWSSHARLIKVNIAPNNLHNRNMVRYQFPRHENYASIYFDIFRGLIAIDTTSGIIKTLTNMNGDILSSEAYNDMGQCLITESTNPCQLGYIYVQNECIPSPAGGFATYSKFVECDKGTVNPNKLAVHKDACVKCPPGFAAISSVICSACNATHNIQSEDGTSCLLTCPNGQFMDYAQKQCRLCSPGFEYCNKTQECVPCPTNFISKKGETCIQCPEGTYSKSNPTMCSIEFQHHHGVDQKPITCYNDGLRSKPTKHETLWLKTIAKIPLHTGTPSAFLILNDDVVLIGTDSGFLYELERKERSIHIPSLTFLDFQVNTISSLASFQNTILFSDSKNGIIMKIKDWNPMYPSKILSYVYVNTSFVPHVIAFIQDKLAFLDKDKQCICIININIYQDTYSTFCHEIHSGIEGYPRWMIHSIAFSTRYQQSDRKLYFSIQSQENSTKELRIGVLSLLENRNQSIQFLANMIFYENVKLSSWLIRDWNDKNSTLLGIGNAFIQLYDNLTSYEHDTADSNNSNWKIVSGHIQQSFYRDGSGDESRFFHVLSATPTNSANAIDSSLIIIDHVAFTVRILYKRSCECNQDFYLYLRNNDPHSLSCQKCPENTFSMLGSRGCTTCPRGFYWDHTLDVPNCISCPALLWSNNVLYAPCRIMQDNLDQHISYTLKEAQFISNTKTLLNVQLNANYLYILFMNDINKEWNVWPSADALGRFWTFEPIEFVRPHDPMQVSVFQYPGIWARCNILIPAPFEECECSVWNLALGYLSFPNGWEAMRLTTSLSNLTNIHRHSIFAYRRHSNQSHNIPNVFDANKVTTIRINSTLFSTDLGICMIGWPAKFACQSPFYYWKWPDNQHPGGACLRCPHNTITNEYDDTNCRNISNQNPICPPGFFRNQSDCIPCPLNTFSSTYSTTEKCIQKISRCKSGQYIQETDGSMDNKCVQCTLCNHLMIPYFPHNPCTGIQTNQPYTCYDNVKSRPGFAAYAQKDLTTKSIGINFIPCEEPNILLANDKKYEWTMGPYIDLCYIQCKYALDYSKIEYYYELINGIDTSLKYRWTINVTSNSIENLFPLPNPIITKQYSHIYETYIQICTECDLTPCLDFMVRPLYDNGCGAPCLTRPSLCEKGFLNGCVFSCQVPKNATFVSYSSTLSKCLWECKYGWFLNEEEDDCIPCTKEICPTQTTYVGDDSCYPTSTIKTVCIQCPQRLNAAILNTQLSKPGDCVYSCEGEGIISFPNPNPYTRRINPCISCINQLNRCPPGYRMQCDKNPCTLCPPLPFLLQGTASYITSNSSVCRIICNANYLPIPVKNPMHILPYNLDRGYDPEEIICFPCNSQNSFKCTSTVSCPFNYAIDIDGISCLKCKNSFEMGCPQGTYAPSCPGGRITQLYCVSCPIYDKLAVKEDLVPGVWPTRLFIPYKDALTKGYVDNVKASLIQDISHVTCPIACVANSIFINNSCIACSILYPRPPPNYPYDQYYALWNASIGLRWWDPKFDPYHLGPRKYDSRTHTLLPDIRAGQCWPCPRGTMEPSPDSSHDDPCTYSDTISKQYLEIKSYVLPQNQPISDIIQVNSKKNVDIWLQIKDMIQINSRGRRLLTSSSMNNTPNINFQTQVALYMSKHNSVIIQNNTMANIKCKKGSFRSSPLGYWCTLCPTNFYCDGVQLPLSCPPPSFTLNEGASSISECKCIRNGNLHKRCHSDSTSLATRVVSTDVWTLIKSFVHCEDGYYKSVGIHSTTITCIPCHPGTYEFNDICIPCPLGSYSGKASSVCLCRSSNTLFIPLMNSFQCQPEGPTKTVQMIENIHSVPECSDRKSTYDPYSNRCQCIPGSFFNSILKKCVLCPIDTFSSKIGSALCVQCPKAKYTTQLGAKSLLECIDETS